MLTSVGMFFPGPFISGLLYALLPVKYLTLVKTNNSFSRVGHGDYSRNNHVGASIIYGNYVYPNLKGFTHGTQWNAVYQSTRPGPHA